MLGTKQIQVLSEATPSLSALEAELPRKKLYKILLSRFLFYQEVATHLTGRIWKRRPWHKDGQWYEGEVAEVKS